MRYFILPAVTAGIAGMATIMRTTRSAILEVYRQDYIKTAEAKGQKESVIIWRHMLKNASLPIITVISASFCGSLANSTVVETVFSMPGMCKLLVDSIVSLDNIVVMGAIMVLAVTCCIVNLVTDLVFAAIDPRIKSQFKRRQVKGSWQGNRMRRWKWVETGRTANCMSFGNVFGEISLRLQEFCLSFCWYLWFFFREWLRGKGLMIRNTMICWRLLLWNIFSEPISTEGIYSAGWSMALNTPSPWDWLLPRFPPWSESFWDRLPGITEERWTILSCGRWISSWHCRIFCWHWSWQPVLVLASSILWLP